MTNKEAYQSNLDDLLNEIDNLLRLVPIGNAKNIQKSREQAEEAARD